MNPFNVSKPVINIALIGDDGACKRYLNKISSPSTLQLPYRLIHRFYDPASAFNLTILEYNKNDTWIQVNIFDVIMIRENHIANIDGIILMYCIDDHATKQNVLTKWIPRIKKLLQKVGSYLPIAILGNQLDKAQTSDDKFDHEIDLSIGSRIKLYDPNQYGEIEHFCVNGLTDENLLNPINWLMDRILSYYAPSDDIKPYQVIMCKL